jgi:hypothetical protein
MNKSRGGFGMKLRVFAFENEKKARQNIARQSMTTA